MAETTRYGANGQPYKGSNNAPAAPKEEKK
mgnify:CR=1 FL=1